jgi:hypothetical protein
LCLPECDLKAACSFVLNVVDTCSSQLNHELSSNTVAVLNRLLYLHFVFIDLLGRCAASMRSLSLTFRKCVGTDILSGNVSRRLFTDEQHHGGQRN